VVADGSNYPARRTFEAHRLFEEGLREIHAALKPGQRLLLEYKPFEPAFYHTDIAMGMALSARKTRTQLWSGRYGHHIRRKHEQIVAWLLHQNMMADFTSTIAICRRRSNTWFHRPLSNFRISTKLGCLNGRRKLRPTSPTWSTRVTILREKSKQYSDGLHAQELYARAALVDHGASHDYSRSAHSSTPRKPFASILAGRPTCYQEWRKSRNLPVIRASFRTSGYLERITRERGEKNRNATASYA